MYDNCKMCLMRHAAHLQRTCVQWVGSKVHVEWVEVKGQYTKQENLSGRKQTRLAGRRQRETYNKPIHFTKVLDDGHEGRQKIPALGSTLTSCMSAIRASQHVWNNPSGRCMYTQSICEVEKFSRITDPIKAHARCKVDWATNKRYRWTARSVPLTVMYSNVRKHVREARAGMNHAEPPASW